jgi:hypothetical protein
MRFLLLLASILSVALSSVPARAASSEDELVVKVRKAIQEGQKYLRAIQDKEKGNWEIDKTCATYPGAFTSLAVLALLETGVPVNDPAIEKGLAYLRTVKEEHKKTYAVSLRTMALARAGLEKDRELIQRNVNWLLKQRMPEGWNYGERTDNVPLSADNSNTQYAVLALHYARQAGAKVDPGALKKIQEFYLRTQRGGGWGYKPPPDKDSLRRFPLSATMPKMTMTAAGLCGLLITGMDVTTSRQKLRADGSAENCGAYQDNDAVRGAIKWIGDAFPRKITMAEAKNLGFIPPFYCLYGIERAGRLSGQRYFGVHDWYRIGCEFLTKQGFQKADGSWHGEEYNLGPENWPLVSTSFALLFLGKTQAPVLVTKLAYGARFDHGWNHKRNDMRNLTAFASLELFADHPLAWQVFDVRTRTVDEEKETRRLVADLLEVPILYFNGHNRGPRIKEEKILKEYLQNGGFLFAEACCGDKAFTEDFKELMVRIFGEDVELKKLPDDHPVWNASGKFTSSPKKFDLWGVQQGCKTVVIFSKTPVAGYWEADLHKAGRGREAFELGANVIAYATGLALPEPRGRKLVVADIEQKNIRSADFRPAQVRLKDEPMEVSPAFLNLLDQLRQRGWKIGQASALDPNSDSEVPRHDFFYLHARDSKTLEPDRKKWDALYDRLKKGGTLFADAAGSSKEVDAAFRKLMEAMWQDYKLKLVPIPADDPLFGKELKTVRRRDKAGGLKTAPYKEEKPLLEGIKYSDRWVVIYSRHDLGCALEYTQALDHVGHDRASAVRLFQAALRYAEETKRK